MLGLAGFSGPFGYSAGGKGRDLALKWFDAQIDKLIDNSHVWKSPTS